jgi:hypothetical protein
MSNLSRWSCVLAVFGLMLAAVVHGQTATLRPQVEKLDEAERLKLETDQRAYTESLKPLAPQQQQELQQRLLQQKLQQRQLQQQQLGDQLLLEQRLKALPGANVRGAENLQIQQFERQQRGLQLQQDMQRETWPYPRRWQ